MPGDEVYVMTPLEVSYAYVFGQAGPLPPPRSTTATPREALEQVILGALQRTPCGVAFSGGRDSSAVLAIAAHVARREGLPDPVPITKVYPNAPRTQEGEWQERVLDHLGLREDWQRIELDDELDVVGPVAQEHLLEHGVVWPPTIHSDRPMLDVLRGGTLLDGEGGDEVLGAGAHRIAAVRSLLAAPRPRTRRKTRRAALAVAPRRVRAARAHRQLDDIPTPWLRPPAQDALREELGRFEAQRPLRFAASVRFMAARRSPTIVTRNRRLLARPRGVDVVSPLLHPDVVHALAREGRVLGVGDRTAALRRLVPDLLPDAVLTRTTKAVFNGAYMARHTREFGERWTGDGVDHELVDPEVLARMWRENQENMLTSALLQTAWLAQRGTRKG